MHVNLNCFDYPALLEGLVKHYDLQDDLSDENIAKIFHNLSEMYRKHADDPISDDDKKMVESFLSASVTFISYEGEDFVVLQDQIENGLELLTLCLSQGIDEVPYGRFNETYVWGKFINEPDIENPDYFEQVDQFIGYLTNRIDQYLESKSINQFGPGELFILGEIEKYTHPGEIVVDLGVIDRPGTKVKYGDSLITFPIILLEVTGEQ